MQWEGRRQSSNIEKGGRGSSRGMMLGGGTLALVGLVVYLFTGNPLLLRLAGTQVQAPPRIQVEEVQFTPEEKELYQYSAVVLADTEDTWNELLPKYGASYREPKMSVFQDAIQTGCGAADKGVGPFYCGADEKIYMDLSFYQMLVQKFGVEEGDFVMSYVISHEVGHHVQNCLGILDKVHRAQQRLSKAEANAMSVRLELQADYLAGVVARYQDKQGYLDEGDIEEAIATAWVIGDDAIEKRVQGRVVPESFTHGTSEQRTRWFKKGYDAGDLSEFNTFDTKKYPDASDL